ncbi:unnamed protein product [Boreogadus saida]
MWRAAPRPQRVPPCVIATTQSDAAGRAGDIHLPPLTVAVETVKQEVAGERGGVGRRRPRPGDTGHQTTLQSPPPATGPLPLCGPGNEVDVKYQTDVEVKAPPSA